MGTLIAVPNSVFLGTDAYGTCTAAGLLPTTTTTCNAGLACRRSSDGRAIELYPPGSPVPTRTVLQTFFVVKRQPNIVFAAANAR